MTQFIALISNDELLYFCIISFFYPHGIQMKINLRAVTLKDSTEVLHT